jgi:hypothetical protein
VPNEGTIVHRPRVYGLAGLLGAAVFTASLVVLHLTRTEVAWTRDYVSHFANGPLGWVFASSALVHGVGNLALTLGLRSSLDPRPLRAWAVALFGVAAAGIVVAALFPIDPTGSSVTFAGLAHRAVMSVSFPLELVALVLFSAAFARHPRWRRHSGVAWVLSAVAAVALTGFLLAVLLNWMPAVAERVALASFLAWEFWAAFQLARPLPVR